MYWMMASSISSPATRTERLVTMPPSEMTATSVVPPPMSTTMLPVGSHTGRSAPMAAANGSSIVWASRAPACSVASSTARCSTAVTPDGTHTITFGRRENKRRFLSALLMKYLIMVAVVSKSAMTPSFIGRIARMLPGVRPIIRLASSPTASMVFVSVRTATTDGSRRTTPFPLAKTSVLAVPRSMPRSFENPSNMVGFLRCHEWIASHMAQFLQADMGLVGDDDVVQKLDADQPARFGKASCHVDVLRTGRRVAARVVVRADDGGAVSLDGRAEHFPRMDDGRVQAADGQRFLADDPIFRVEEQDDEMFLRQKAQLVPHAFGRIARRAELRRVIQRGAGQLPAQFDPRLELQGFGWADALDGGRLLHGHVRQVAQPAAGGQHLAGEFHRRFVGRAGPEKNGQKLRVAQRFRPVPQEPFPRP